MKKFIAVSFVLATSASGISSASACELIRDSLRPYCKTACQLLPEGAVRTGCMIGAPAPHNG